MPGDLTDCGTAQTHRQAPSAVLEALWIDAKAALVLCDSDRRVCELNPAAGALFARLGIDPSRLTAGIEGRGHERLAFERALQRPLQLALKGEWPPEDTFAFAFPGQSDPRRMAVSARPARLAGSLGALLVWRDVTDSWNSSQQRRIELDQLSHLHGQLQQQLLERSLSLQRQGADLAALNAELDGFAYSVSHDLRAPLRAISGFSRIIEQQFGERLPQEALGYLGKVVANAQRMGALIDALLLFSRMQRQSLNPQQIDMTRLVADCWSSLGPAREGREIEFVLEPLPVAQGDLRLVGQVWTNLLDNAIKFTARRRGARVEVGARFRPGTEPVGYEVHDNGAGFDMRYVGKIGQVFQRLHPVEDFPGTGIGLALVQRIVQRHGGRMSAVGEPGVGASVGFTLGAGDPGAET